MSTTDDIARTVALRVNDRNFERLREIKDYIEDTVTELTMALRKGAVLYNATVSVNGTTKKGTLPDDVFTVLRVANTAGARYDIVDNDTFRTRSEQGTGALTAFVKEDKPNWTIEIINTGSDAVTLSIDYLVASKNPNILPEYYENVIKAGTEAAYHLRRSTRDKYIAFNQEYTRLKTMYLENQQYNDTSVTHVKSLDQIENESAQNQQVTNNNYINVRGLY
jgi:hypothetical protein